jgi:hypothetical protein
MQSLSPLLKADRTLALAVQNPDRRVTWTSFSLLLPQVPIKQRECLDKVSIIEESMVKGFPFEVPKEYSQLPQLLVGVPQESFGLGCWCGASQIRLWLAWEFVGPAPRQAD